MTWVLVTDRVFYLGFLSLIVLIFALHSTTVLDSGDTAFTQLAASPHSMDSVLQAGEGNSCAQGIPACVPWEQLMLPAHLCCPSALRFVHILRKIRFSFGSEPHLLRVAVVK